MSAEKYSPREADADAGPSYHQLVEEHAALQREVERLQRLADEATHREMQVEAQHRHECERLNELIEAQMAARTQLADELTEKKEELLNVREELTEERAERQRLQSSGPSFEQSRGDSALMDELQDALAKLRAENATITKQRDEFQRATENLTRAQQDAKSLLQQRNKDVLELERRLQSSNEQIEALTADIQYLKDAEKETPRREVGGGSTPPQLALSGGIKMEHTFRNRDRSMKGERPLIEMSTMRFLSDQPITNTPPQHGIEMSSIKHERSNSAESATMMPGHEGGGGSGLSAPLTGNKDTEPADEKKRGGICPCCTVS